MDECVARDLRLGGLAVIALAEAVIIVRLSKALKAMTRFGERLAHLASALELLTDTTEAGLDQRRPRPRAQRAATCRTHDAWRDVETHCRGGEGGRAIEEIAADESMSESEVRLHLQMNAQVGEEGARDGALRG